MASNVLLRRVGLDIAAWLVVCAVFLAVYVVSLSLPGTAVLPHLRVVATLWLAMAAVRLLAQALPGRRVPRLASSVLLGVTFALLLAYYALVVVGLTSWGEIVSAELIRTYALQFPAFVDALGLSVITVVATLVVVGALVVVSVYWVLSRFDWVPLLWRSLSPAAATAIGIASLGIVATQSYQFLAAPWTHEREPISLTLFPHEAGLQVQTHRIDRVHADLLDRAEDAARAAYVPSEAPNKRNLIVIVVDALRPDHLGLLGYARSTTPNLVALAGRANRLLATSVHASCAESACGLISLASSKYLHQFSRRPFTLEEALKRNGYAIHLILGGDHTHFYGLREAYGDVDTYFDASMARDYYMNDDRAVVGRVAALPEWNGRPTMFQFHLMSAHVLGPRQARFQIFEPAASYWAPAGQPATGGRASALAENYYDNGVLQADDVIADLLRRLDAKGYLADAVVVVTADHGELLGEHGLYGHAKSVYEEVLRVPFVMMSFSRADPSHSVLSVAHGGQVDVAPTLLEELRLPIPATWSGTPLQHGGSHAFGYFQERSLVGIYDYRAADRMWKYSVDAKTHQERVVDLKRNPGEREETTAVPPEVLREWRGLVLPMLRGALD